MVALIFVASSHDFSVLYCRFADLQKLFWDRYENGVNHVCEVAMLFVDKGARSNEMEDGRSLPM